MKTCYGLVGLGLALFAASMPAHAFQEQRVGGEAASEKPAQGATSGATGHNLATPEQQPGKATSGTEVRIPGLGKLGVIPKVDFGLELLYGAADPKRPSEPPAGSENAEGVTLRGKLKF